MINFIKRLICRYKGHDWVAYPYYHDVYDSIPEMAGGCQRCGVDTHEDTNK